MSAEPGSLILVNGPSSAGKSTLCRAAQPLLERPFLHYSMDLIFFGGVLPRDDAGRPRDWLTLRPRVVEGFLHGLRGFLDAGVDVLWDHIIESATDRDMMLEVLDGVDVFWVGLHVSAEELARRELERGDRRIGDAIRDLASVHTFVSYDLELDGNRPPDDNARVMVGEWRARQT